MRTEVETGPSTVDFRPTEHVEFVLLVIPDANGSLRGKALRPDAFEAAVRHGTVMTDLLLALDPVDVPISDYGKFGIRSGAADLVVHPDTSTLMTCGGAQAGGSVWERRAGPMEAGARSHRARCCAAHSYSCGTSDTMP